MITTASSKLNERKQRAIARLIVGFQGLEPQQEWIGLFEGHTPAGAILFARNVETQAQTLSCIQQLSTMWSPNEVPWISLDQEGGRVRRIKEIGWPAMRRLGEINDLDLTKQLVRALNSEVRHWGFTGNWAPCADVDSNPDNPVIGDRAFSRSPEQTAAHVIATMEAMRSVGVMPCIKHFPGHGDTDVDSHLDLPWVRKTESELERCEWVPFQRAIQAGVEVIMTAHVMFPALDTDYPATMSHTILTGLLRQRFGYQGVIVSDDMEMKAVRGRYPVAEQMDIAVRAGVDAFLVCSEADLQAECIETLVKLQEQSAEHEAYAEASIQRLRRLQIQHQQMMTTPPLNYHRDEWIELTLTISEQMTPSLL